MRGMRVYSPYKDVFIEVQSTPEMVNDKHHDIA